MKRRGYKVSVSSLSNFYLNLYSAQHYFPESTDNLGVEKSNIYYEWHSPRYLRQCYCNLQEKFDCGGVPEDEWLRIVWYVSNNEGVLHE